MVRRPTSPLLSHPILLYHTVRLHDIQENRITGLVRLWVDFFKMHVYTLVWLKSDWISHSRIKTPRLFDWWSHYSCMYRSYRIRSDFHVLREPKVEGRQRRRLSSEITTRKSVVVHLVCVIIVYTIYEMYIDVASSRSSYAIFLKCWGSLLLSPLVEMRTAPPIVPGYDMLRTIIRFSHGHVYSNNCSCLIE